jgi:hypothetical protein
MEKTTGGWIVRHSFVRNMLVRSMIRWNSACPTQRTRPVGGGHLHDGI